MSAPAAERPHVVILGAGFGGLEAARALRHAPARVTVVDRRNHHLFQPLLYQVATAGLSPAEIASPIRRILRKQENTSVVLAEARSIDVAGRRVVLADGESSRTTGSWWRREPRTRTSATTSGSRSRPG